MPQPPRNLPLLLNRLEVGVIVLDQEHRVVVWNDWIAARSNLSEAAVLGRRIDDVFSGGLSARVRTAIGQALTHQQASIVTASLNRALLPLYQSVSPGPEAHAEPLDQSLIVRPLRDGDERYCVIQVNDLTEARRRERYLRNQTHELAHLAEHLSLARDAAELANRAKSQFLSNMSHELRTPLNVIIGFAEVLANSLSARQSEQSDFVQQILEAGNRLLGTINDLLESAKIESGDASLLLEIANLNELIEACLLLLRERAKASGIALEISKPTPRIRVQVDRRKFMGIILNLMSNAIKFTPSGGHARLTVALSPAQGLILTIEDTGIGIAPDHLDAVMQPFIQVDASMIRRTDGTGLGLPLAKSFAELHGGSLHIESALSSGTRVTVVLPPRCVIDQDGA